MSVFFITDREARQSEEDALLGPTQDATAPPWWSVDFGEVGRRAWRGILNLDANISEVGATLSNIPNSALQTPDYLLPSDPVQRAATRRITDPHYEDRTAVARWFEEQRDVSRQERDYRFRRDTRVVSEATNIIAGLAEVMTPALIMGPLGPAGAATGLASSSYEGAYSDLRAQGVDEETARGGALQTGAYMAAMGVAPVALPGRLWQRALSGAAINTGFGASLRRSLQP